MSPPNGVPAPNVDDYRDPSTFREEKTPSGDTCASCEKRGFDPGDEDEGIAPLKNDHVRPQSRKASFHPLEIDDSSQAEMVVPPDGGWGWAVVVASFLCNMIVDGIIFSFGMFQTAIKDEFRESESQVAVIGSLLSGFYLIVGPFVSALANRWGFRVVTVIGSLIGSGAFVASYFAGSVQTMYFTYGILGGVGFGMVYVPAVITVGYYFEKWRALATGIAVCGSGIGTFVFSPLSKSLIEKFGWRWAILIQGFIFLGCIFCGLVFRPIKPVKISDITLTTVTKKDEISEAEKELSLMNKIKLAKDLSLKRTESQTSIEEHQRTIPHLFGVNNNTQYPTAEEIFVRRKLTSATSALSLDSDNKCDKFQKRLSVPTVVTVQKAKEVETVKIGDAQDAAPLLNGRGSQPVIVNNRRNSQQSNKGEEVNRPFYRDDIFFGGSLARLPQYTSKTSVAYHMSVTRLPTQADRQESKFAVCSEAIRRTLGTMLDISLLKSPSFLLLAVSGAMTMMGFFIPFVYINARAESGSVSKSGQMWLVSVIGICNTIGRVLCGAMSSFPKVSVLAVNNAALTVGGIATLVSGLSITDPFQFTYAVIFGLSISCFASLRSILVVELVGLDKLTNAFGLLLLFQGVAATVGSPLAGAFRDLTGSFDATFYLAGSLILVSAIVCYPLNAIKRWEVSREKKNVPV